jgi:hypothetical protein
MIQRKRVHNIHERIISLPLGLSPRRRRPESFARTGEAGHMSCSTNERQNNNEPILALLLLRGWGEEKNFKNEKMKKAVFLLMIGLTINLSFGQETQKETTKTIDPNLVGCWKGSEVDQQQKGMSKYWVSCRFEDGKSTLLFVMINKKGKVTQTTENGKWWVENGKYYELHNVDGITDVYEYQVIDDSIKFTGIEVLDDKETKYTFFDYKIEE